MGAERGPHRAEGQGARKVVGKGLTPWPAGRSRWRSLSGPHLPAPPAPTPGPGALGEVRAGGRENLGGAAWAQPVWPQGPPQRLSSDVTLRCPQPGLSPGTGRVPACSAARKAPQAGLNAAAGSHSSGAGAGDKGQPGWRRGCLLAVSSHGLPLCLCHYFLSLPPKPTSPVGPGPATDLLERSTFLQPCLPAPPLAEALPEGRDFNMWIWGTSVHPVQEVIQAPAS